MPNLDALEEDEVDDYGVLPGTRSREPVGGFVDKRDDFIPIPREPMDDEEEIAETAEGLTAWRHPEAMLLERPHLWPVVSEFRSGLPRELTHTDYATRSAWWVSAWTALSSAHHRRVMREAENRRAEAEATDG